MDIISKQLVDTIRMQVSQYSVEQVLPDQKKFMNNQPYIVQFIIQFTEDDQHEDVSKLALHLAHVLWKAFSEANDKPLVTIPFESLIEEIKDREEWLEIFSDMNYEIVSRFIQKEPSLTQPYIMDCLLDIIVEEGRANPEIGEQEQGYIFWLMLIIVDLFDRIN